MFGASSERALGFDTNTLMVAELALLSPQEKPSITGDPVGWKGAVGGYIVGFFVFALVVVDGPLPIGDALAMAILAGVYTRTYGMTAARMGNQAEDFYNLSESRLLNQPPVIQQMNYFDSVTYYV